MKQRWMHTRVGPLPPILRETTPASTTKVIVEIHHWFSRMYGNDTVFMKTAWEKVVSILSENTDQTLDLANSETYRVAMPISLTSSTLTHYRFTVSSSLPATNIFSGEATDELLLALLTQLSAKIGVNAHPEDILAREPAELEGGENTITTPKKIVICGGSNCKRLAADLTTMGVPVIDLCVPGWVPTPANIDKLTAELTEIGKTYEVVLVGDMISNVSFCFEQLNGTLALPVKSGGKFHMYGKVCIGSKESLVNVLEKIVPVLRSVNGLKIVLPPLPRYLYSPCCQIPGHCEGLQEPGYVPELLCKTRGIRKIIRDHLHTRVGDIWVPDTVTTLTTDGGVTDPVPDNIRHLFGTDGVHLSRDGATHYADIVKELINEKISAACVVSGKGAVMEYFWRGFVSPVGSNRPSNQGAFHQNRSFGGGKRRGLSSGNRSGGGGWRPYPDPSSAPRRR